jgi:hypothetical protein
MKIALLPIKFYDRKEAEKIENCELLNENVKKVIEKAIIMEISDFMDLFNNQEINMDEYWITYIK